MPSYSRSNSRTRYDAPASPESSDEDFVNTAASAPVSSSHPASRSSNLSGASRSSRPHKVHQSSSSESTDFEEERELEAELLDADLEVGMVRDAPVESRAAQIMRSVGKGSSGGGRRYSALNAAEQGGLDRSSSGRSHKSHKASRSRRAAAMYDLEKNPADPTAEHAEFACADDPNAETALMGTEQPHKPKPKGKNKGKKMPAAGAVTGSPGGTPGRSNTKRIWCYVLLAIILIILVALVIVVAVKATQKKKNSIADGSSTDSLVSDVASSTAALSSSAAVSDTSSLSTTEQPFSYGNTATSNSVKESASSPITTYNDGQYYPSTATSTGTGFRPAATLESS
ncbi:hypothetical protein JCM21900_006809 [Sporobolomyces salmonicolor]